MKRIRMRRLMASLGAFIILPPLELSQHKPGGRQWDVISEATRTKIPQFWKEPRDWYVHFDLILSIFLI